jgi:hypothetical protein
MMCRSAPATSPVPHFQAFGASAAVTGATGPGRKRFIDFIEPYACAISLNHAHVPPSSLRMKIKGQIELGSWTEGGIMAAPRGPLTWELASEGPHGTRIARANNKVVATIQAPPAHRGNWTVRIPGWLWHTVREQPGASKPTVMQTEVMTFPTLLRAKFAVATAFAVLNR